MKKVLGDECERPSKRLLKLQGGLIDTVVFGRDRRGNRFWRPAEQVL